MIIVLNVVGGQVYEKTDTVGWADPYVRIKYGDHERKTRTIKNERNPVWDEKFTFDYSKDEPTLTFDLFDWEKIGKHKLIGTGFISVVPYIQNKQHVMVYITNPDKKKPEQGYLGIDIEVQGDDSEEEIIKAKALRKKIEDEKKKQQEADAAAAAEEEKKRKQQAEEEKRKQQEADAADAAAVAAATAADAAAVAAYAENRQAMKMKRDEPVSPLLKIRYKSNVDDYTDFLERKFTAGVWRWTIACQYRHSKRFCLGAGNGNEESMCKWKENFLGTFESSSFDFRKDNTCLRGVQGWNAGIDPKETQVENGSYVGIELNVSARTLCFFVEGDRIPRAVCNFFYPSICLGVSSDNHWEREPDVHSVSLMRLVLPTFSSTPCTYYPHSPNFTSLANYD